MKPKKSDNSNFWESKYKEGILPWDIGQAAPAFIKYLNKLGDERQETKDENTKVCILGCGLGHDALYFAGKGYEVHAFDFSFAAITHCNNLKEEKKLKNIFFYHIDFFNLFSQKKWRNFFDIVIEHTSFCAVNPQKRKEYVELIHYLLKPGGKLLGLFFIRPLELGGPPFGSSKEEIETLFLQFNFIEVERLHFEECLHQGKLEGDEYFGVFEKN